MWCATEKERAWNVNLSINLPVLDHCMLLSLYQSWPSTYTMSKPFEPAEQDSTACWKLKPPKNGHGWCS
jgi:hypothetical protein